MIHRLGSGTYNVRESEDIPPPPPTLQSKSILKKKFIGGVGSSITQNIICTVHFLNDSIKEFHVGVCLKKFFFLKFLCYSYINLYNFFQKNAIGEDLLTIVYNYLELEEKDFFGLQFISLLDSNWSKMVRKFVLNLLGLLFLILCLRILNSESLKNQNFLRYLYSFLNN